MTDMEVSIPALQLDVSEQLDDFDMPESGRLTTNTTLENGTVDKEMLRKIKRKERNKQNRRKRKTLQSNLSQVTASDLQQSVAALATSIGAKSSCIVNDPLNMPSYGASQSHEMPVAIHGTAGIMNTMSSSLVSGTCPATAAAASVPNGAAAILSRPASETALCIMDSTNFNVRLGHPDLAYINDYLEKCMYKDLVTISKLKIASTYLSTAKRVWVICHSPFTAGWVIRRVAEMPVFNGRKFTAQTLSEMDGMTKVTVLVPKECAMIQDFPDLMRFLTIQNPGLGLGTTMLEMIVTPNKKIQQESSQDSEAHSEENNGMRTIDEANSDLTDAFEDKEQKHDAFGDVEETPPSADGVTAAKVASTSPDKGSSVFTEAEKPASQISKSRSFSFYADDTWICELRRLGYRPYLGMRRLLCVVGERVLKRGQENVRKRRRGGARKPKWALRTESETTGDVHDRITEDNTFQ